ncbi:MAG: HAD hydrolase-like protein [Spirochaetales bacterium]|nr:HAD hydrolase-like protein [Spirochaetales bacterium]
MGTREIDEWLDKDGIRDLFCTVQQSSITMLRKPHPAIYYLALKEAHVRPEESVFVGDNLIRDIIGAKATGFAGTIAVEYNPEKPLKLTRENQPDCIIHSFPEILNVLPGDKRFCPESAERRTV